MNRGKKIISESNASQLSWNSFKVKRWSHFQLSGESNPGLLSFCSTLFFDWLKKNSRDLLNVPIRFKTKANRDSVARVLSRFDFFFRL